MITLVNPCSLEVIGSVREFTPTEVEDVIDSALASQISWAKDSQHRKEWMLKASAIIRENALELIDLEVRDCGKLYREATSEVELAAQYFEFYSELVELPSDPIKYPYDGCSAYVVHEPKGVTGHIIPWNYPLMLFARTVAPSIAIGNTCVVKAAEKACLSVVRVCELLKSEAIFLVTGGAETGRALAGSSKLSHVSFIGSRDVGTKVAEAAARNQTPLTLELGGKSPQIVFSDADQEAARRAVISGIMENAGQMCSAGSRLLVHEDIYEEFLAQLRRDFTYSSSGFPTEFPTCGPLISAEQKERAEKFVDEAISAGCKVTRGRASTSNGHFFAPTLIEEANPSSRCAREEIFAPVLVVFPFKSTEDAISIANDSEYGLVASIWTSSEDLFDQVSRRLDVGQVFMNSFGGPSGLELPFGGVKGSGYGKEKGIAASYEVSRAKTILKSGVL